MSKNYSLNATPPNEQRIPAEDAVIDPLVPTVGANNMAGSVTLKTIEMVHEALGAIINLGASKVSFSLPERHTIKQVFLSLAIATDAICAITDPMKLSMTIRAVDLLGGRDDYAGRYFKHYRKLTAENES